MEQTRKETVKADLDRRRNKLRRGRKWLIFFLFVQVFIAGLVHREMLAEEYNLLLFAKVLDWLRETFWPSPLHQDTYRLLIAKFWTWITELRFYPLLEKVAPKVLPAGLLLNIFLTVLNRLRLIAVTRSPAPKKEKTRPAPIGRASSGLLLPAQILANRRCRQLHRMSSYDDELFLTPGIRVQFLSGNTDKLVSEEIHFFRNSGKLTINAGLDKAQLFFLDDRGNAYMDAQDEPIAMESGVPLIIRSDRGDESCIHVAYTWLGGY